jgi:hypothetical protein
MLSLILRRSRANFRISSVTKAQYTRKMSGFDTGMPPPKVQDMFEKVEIDTAVSARKFLVFGNTLNRSTQPVRT